MKPRQDTHVVLPRNVLERDGVDVLVKDERDGDREVEHVEALGTERVRQDLERVRDDEGREREAVKRIRQSLRGTPKAQARATHS